MAGIDDESSPIDFVPDFILYRIFTNLPLIEQFITLRLVNNRFWHNSPDERRLKSISIEKYFVEARPYSELMARCGGKWLRNLHFDNPDTPITAEILIPFADNCSNIRSIKFSELSDDAAAILPRFTNLENLSLDYCTSAIREAIRNLRLVKLYAGYVDISDPQQALVAEPARLRVLTGADFSGPDIDECGAVMTQFIRNFPNLQVLRIDIIGDVEKLDVMFEIPLIRNYFVNLKHLRFMNAELLYVPLWRLYDNKQIPAKLARCQKPFSKNCP